MSKVRKQSGSVSTSADSVSPELVEETIRHRAYELFEDGLTVTIAKIGLELKKKL